MTIMVKLLQKNLNIAKMKKDELFSVYDLCKEYHSKICNELDTTLRYEIPYELE